MVTYSASPDGLRAGDALRMPPPAGLRHHFTWRVGPGHIAISVPAPSESDAM